MPKCQSRGADIRFHKSVKTGNYMPIDDLPVEDGNIVIIDGEAHTLCGDLFESMHEGPRYMSHFATCPAAAKHRKEK